MVVALNFPNAPAIGDTWPNPPQTGVPTYKWDGTDWLATFALGKPMVPLDGSAAMTGPLILSGDPTLPLGASTKQYVDTLLGSSLSGLTLSADGATQQFGVAKGKATDSTAVTSMVLPSAYIKTAASWALGTGTGGLDAGIIAASTWYHVYLIKRPDTGVVDVVFSLSATAPTLPANYTLFRRIGSLKTNASTQFLKFIQDGDTFTWDNPPADISVTNPGTASLTRTLSTPPGVRVEAIIMIGFGAPAQSDNPAAIYVSDLLIADRAPSVGTGTLYVYSGSLPVTNASLVTRIFTNLLSQIRVRLQLSSTNTQFYVVTYGWNDRRGRD